MNQSLAGFEFRGETSPVHDRVKELENLLHEIRPILIAWSCSYTSAVTEGAIAKIDEVLK